MENMKKEYKSKNIVTIVMMLDISGNEYEWGNTQGRFDGTSYTRGHMHLYTPCSSLSKEWNESTIR